MALNIGRKVVLKKLGCMCLVSCWLVGASAIAVQGDYAFKAPGDEGIIDSQRYLGHVVWVDFWAAWCAPCQQSFPWMQKMLDRHQAQGLRVLTVNIDREQTFAHQFLDKLSSTLPVAYDPQMTLYEQYGVRQLPASFLFDRRGRLIEKHIGFSPEAFEASIVRALEASE